MFPNKVYFKQTEHEKLINTDQNQFISHIALPIYNPQGLYKISR